MKDTQPAREVQPPIYLAISDYAPIRAALQTLPLIGSALDTLLFDEAKRIKEERLKETLNDLDRRLKLVDASKIDKTYLNSPEFLQLFENMFSKIMLEASTEKRKILRSAITNATMLDSAQYREEDVVEILLVIRPDHIRALQHFSEILEGKKSCGLARVAAKSKTLAGTLTGLSLVDLADVLERLVSLGVISKDSEVNVANNGPEDDPDVEVDVYYTLRPTGSRLLSLVHENGSG